MKFKFIFGKKGYGKSEYILNEIKNINDRKILIIVPSHNTFMMENRVLEYLGESALSKIEIMDFKKLTFKLLNIFKAKTKNKITNIGKYLLVNYLIRNNYNQFLYFKKNNSTNLSDEILSILVDFKNFNIDKNSINDILNNLNSDMELYKKIRDLDYINDLYNDYLDKNYLDSLDDMKIVNEIIKESDELFNYYDIYIDGFDIFTYYQYEFLKIIMDRSNKITISLTLDKFSNSIIYNEIFKIKNRIRELLFDKNCSDYEEVYLIDIDKSEDLKYLDRNYLKYDAKAYDYEVRSIFLNKSLDNFYEVEELCKKIRSLVINKGYRYKEIGVVCRDIDSYENFIRVSFDEFNIPYFIDKKNEITSNVFSIFLFSIFEIFENNFSNNALFTYIKSGLLDLNDEEIFLIENFVQENGISKYKWKSDFIDEDCVRYRIEDMNKDHIDISDINNIRKKIINPLMSLFNKVKDKNSVNYFIKEFYGFLKEFGFLDKVSLICETLKSRNDFINANELIQIVNNVFDILDEINDIFRNEEMSFSEFMNILINSISKIEISHVPMRMDEILIGDIERLKIGNYKVLFVIGCNSINFPKSYKKEDLINDLEKDYIKNLGFEFSITNMEKNLSENYYIYSLLNIPKDKIYISYSISSIDGTSMTPSILISKIKKIFPKIIEENTTIIKNDFSLDKMYSMNSTLSIFISDFKNCISNGKLSNIQRDLYNFYINNEEFKYFLRFFLMRIRGENYNDLLDLDILHHIYKNSKFSISSIEVYSKCPFKYFLDYIIKIKTKRLFSFETYDYGNIVHFLMENICKNIIKSCDFSNLSKDEIDKFIVEYFNNVIFSNKNKSYILNNNFKFKAFAQKIRKIVSDAVFFTGRHLSNTEFFHKYYEFEFGKTNSKIELVLNDGRKASFVGKIDRIDFCKSNNEVFINIIDYKSSIYDIDYGKIYNNLNIQTIAYMNCIIRLYRENYNINLSPCAIFYFTISKPVIKNKKGIDLIKEIGKYYRYSGFLIDDIEKINLIDRNVLNGNGSIVSVKINKNGEIAKHNSSDSILTENEFNDMLEFVHNSIKDKILKIYDGNIEVCPVLDDMEQSKCSYCNYIGICKFTKHENKFKIVNELDKSSFLNLIRKGSN
ncbi:PD-(D/E)XK nuclease family protein [Candidatus Arthromitus sp. SFB-rat-Yit]|uniref:PD-(D/E)XK nuclease family protein n=1 Tax=Candidatus Arthromitus sp. SFB-rat-Yit TaxID=1041504 RepID=UPI000227A5BE|nr:PD-(D/E)XK nuclease family protein [Candidatus Arthromitus sp. SFB-rat-Yit]BAK80572.1 ATP-dependent nuclease subunit B [Candidatus Arthromitus sp. SFB-rat-Yit]